MMSDGQGTSDGVAARGCVNGRDPRQRRGRDSTDRCVPVRSPLPIRRPKGLSTTESEKIIILKSPLQRSGDVIYDHSVSTFHPCGMPCAPVTFQVASLLLTNVPEAATPLSQSLVVPSEGSVANNALTYWSLLQPSNIRR